jgi:hypothetical protein
VPVTTVVLLVVLALALRTPREPLTARGRSLAFAAWAAAGVLGAFATLSFALGLLVLPLAVCAVLVAAWQATRAEVLGLLVGVGVMCLVVAAAGAGGEGVAWDWAVAGVAVGGAGLAVYGARRRASAASP